MLHIVALFFYCFKVYGSKLARCHIMLSNAKFHYVVDNETLYSFKIRIHMYIGIALVVQTKKCGDVTSIGFLSIF